MSGGWQQTSLGEPHIAFLQRRPFHPFPISSDLVILYIVFNLDVKGVYSEREEAVTKNDQKSFHQILVGSIRNPSRLTKKTTFIWWKKILGCEWGQTPPKAAFCPKVLNNLLHLLWINKLGVGVIPFLYTFQYSHSHKIHSVVFDYPLIIHPYLTVEDKNHVHIALAICA